MKKLVIVALLLSGMTALAQKEEMKGRQHSMKDLNPEQIATLQTKKMTLALDLTEAQQTKLKSVFMANATERKAKMEARKAQKESGKKLTSDEKYTMHNERLDHQIAQKKKMKELLNEEQYAKWEKMQHRKGKHSKGEGRKGKSKEHKKDKE